MTSWGALARLTVVALGVVVPASAGSAAGPSGLAGAPPGALSCGGCHAERAGSETSVPPIDGRPVDDIVAAMEAFRAGTRPATVMNRIAPGFTQAETRAIAVWLSERAPVR